MSNIKFYTNRQIALQMAMELCKEKSGTTKSKKEDVIKTADEFYSWLQDAPQKDSDNKEWLKINEIK